MRHDLPSLARSLATATKAALGSWAPIAMSAPAGDRLQVSRLLTIVVCSSPVPSNPDTTTLRAVFASLRLVRGLPRCPKLVHFDGPQAALPTKRALAYDEFKRRVTALSTSHEDFQHTAVHASSKFLFSAHNLAAAVALVNTSFMLILQHDYQLARPFDVRGLLRTMQNSTIVKHVRLNARANIVRGFDGVLENYTAPDVYVPLTKTCGWSDCPHFASVHYYRNVIIPMNRADHNGGRRKFMEESVHYRMQRNGNIGGCWELKRMVARGLKRVWPADFAKYGTFLCGFDSPLDGSYTVHRSLRGNVPQWGFDAPAHGRALAKRPGVLRASRGAAKQLPPNRGSGKRKGHLRSRGAERNATAMDRRGRLLAHAAHGPADHGGRRTHMYRRRPVEQSGREA